ncbi:TetR/AcrR family transcriptional regulator [Thermanaeromonas sp. C210]|uniref:TetR/AcrR family transcriptional regulator n=1 Tax=Thermanaeromonas sp. C210 TaxID=2731925 RepID=UPI00155D2FB7|nr:TetR/AcrR family transcriptional regulator [Thermanaeromonas sp. C210]GFN21824.1 TetR family transcriptional regulator [Thermanaeromonas sp. C210]
MAHPAIQSKERILSAAEEIFAAKGLRGARVDEIAAKAKVNKGMLYHYFRSKEDLYAAVLEANFEKVLAATSQAAKGKGDPKEQLVEAIKTYFYFLAQNPHFARLMSWEALEGGVYARKVLPLIWEEGLPQLKGILEEGKARGVFRPDLDIRQMLTSISSLCISYFTKKDILAVLWQDNPAHPQNLEKRLEHILDLVLKNVLL